MGAGASAAAGTNDPLEEAYTEKISDYLMETRPKLIPRVVFRAIDKQRKGFTLAQFQDYLEEKINPNKNEIGAFNAVLEDVFKAMDKDGSGRIQSREFNAWLKSFTRREGANRFNKAKSKASNQQAMAATTRGRGARGGSKTKDVTGVNNDEELLKPPGDVLVGWLARQQRRELLLRRSFLDICAREGALVFFKETTMGDLEAAGVDQVDIAKVKEEVCIGLQDAQKNAEGLIHDLWVAEAAEDAEEAAALKKLNESMTALDANLQKLEADKSSPVDVMDDLRVQRSLAQDLFEQAAAAVELNRVLRASSSTELPEGLVAAAIALATEKLKARVFKSKFTMFKKANVKGKHVGDLDEKVKAEYKVFEGDCLLADKEVAEAADNFADDLADFEGGIRASNKDEHEASGSLIRGIVEKSDNACTYQLKSSAQVREEVASIFDTVVAQMPTDGSLSLEPEKGDAGYIPFTATRLGKALFTDRGTVELEFWSHMRAIEPYGEAHSSGLAGYRPSWGALMTAVMHEFSDGPRHYLSKAGAAMRCDFEWQQFAS